MILKKLEVSNFRNHSKTALVLSPGVNVLVGKNAQGKTNLLEAVYLTCVGRGWRTNKDREMINFNADTARVSTVAAKKFGDCNIEIRISRTEKKSVKINSIPIQKMGELMGQVNCVFFSPDELRLIKDAPADRRRFLDIDISQIDKTYFYSLLRYNKILLQRNTLLKSTTEDIARGLDVWDVQLAKAGAFIISRRLMFISQLKDNVVKVHNYLTSGKENITLSYINITSSEKEETFQVAGENEIEAILMTQLKAAREKDMRLKTTTVGPHRDDMQILIGGKDVRYFASQGQQRTVALSLKLSELEIFKTFTGEMPILLLDDVFSELDADRREKLIKTLSKCQSIITATKFDGSSFQNIKIFEVQSGKIIDQK